jgi:hypothetical protein
MSALWQVRKSNVICKNVPVSGLGIPGMGTMISAVGFRQMTEKSRLFKDLRSEAESGLAEMGTKRE